MLLILGSKTKYRDAFEPWHAKTQDTKLKIYAQKQTIASGTKARLTLNNAAVADPKPSFAPTTSSAPAAGNQR